MPLGQSSCQESQKKARSGAAKARASPPARLSRKNGMSQ